MRALAVTLSLLAACGNGADHPIETPADDPATAQLVARAEHAVAAGRCLACHPAEAPRALQLQPLPAPSLRGLGSRRAAGWLPGFLVTHGRVDAVMAQDLAAFLRDATGAPAPLRRAPVDEAQIVRGEADWQRLGCVACHAADGIPDLDRRTDHASTLAFLHEPTATRPDLFAHDFALTEGEASGLAAFLLRAQRAKGSEVEVQGLAFECFELPIPDGERPDLAGRTPQAQGTTAVPDVSVRSRDDHFALRFRGEIEIPRAGEWTFTLGSDDGSWLWLGEALVVENGGIKPHQRRSGTVTLPAGWQPLTLVYTEAQGGESLELLWRGPQQKQQAVPATAFRARTAALVPPADLPAPDQAAIERGRAAFAARRCGACHAADGLPAPQALARPFATLPDATPCPEADSGVGASLRRVGALPRGPRAELAFQLLRGGCQRCHVHHGAGGVRESVRHLLPETEDLGDEGRLPPDLTAAGARLRPAWIEGVLAGDKRARPYLSARMPRLPGALASAYAQAFAAADAPATDDAEPAFAPAMIEEGVRVAGSEGVSCITCHPFGEARALGAQGMDLMRMHERTRPGWFRDWLLRPAELRPGTRMPTFWPAHDAADRRKIDALRAWLGLGAAAPVPKGLRASDQSLLLEPLERPVLHGAFLDGLSARCLAVGTPQRTHYAYDLANLRLAWLWRGAFLDAAGTWSGRAGKLLRPLGQDHVLLPEGCPFTAVPPDPAPPRLLGWDFAADGQPVFRLQVGSALVEDAPRPRLTAGGSELVRTVTVRGGAVKMTLPAAAGPVRALVGNATPADLTIGDGETVEVLYRW